MSTKTRTFWLEGPGTGCIREEVLPLLPSGWCRIETECCGISPGTERLVAMGRVPMEARSAMRCQYMAGDFAFPLRYGYSLVGRCVEGPVALTGRRVHVMHPHQERCIVEVNAVYPVPEGIPPIRATLASNLETAVNALWDSHAQVGERAAVVGFGVVGSLVTRLFSMIPGTEILVVDTAQEKRRLAETLGFPAAESADAGVFDLAFESSGSPQGLQAALDAVGPEGRVVSLSWHGNSPVSLRLGSDFHYGRKRIVSSQVSRLPAKMLPRWDAGRRKELVFQILRSSAFDLHVTDVIEFSDLPAFFRNLCDGGYHGLSAAVRFDNLQES